MKSRLKESLAIMDEGFKSLSEKEKTTKFGDRDTTVNMVIVATHGIVAMMDAVIEKNENLHKPTKDGQC